MVSPITCFLSFLVFFFLILPRHFIFAFLSFQFLVTCKDLKINDINEASKNVKEYVATSR